MSSSTRSKSRVVENPLNPTFRGEGHVRKRGCTLQAHFAQWQALSDAMQFAAQLEMEAAIREHDELARERAYGKWLGAKGFLRLAEGSTYDLTPAEAQMLARIDWRTESFMFPGKESFPPVDEQVLPGG